MCNPTQFLKKIHAVSHDYLINRFRESSRVFLKLTLQNINWRDIFFIKISISDNRNVKTLCEITEFELKTSGFSQTSIPKKSSQHYITDDILLATYFWKSIYTMNRQWYSNIDGLLCGSVKSLLELYIYPF
jgi:hypothetical protein